MICVQPNGSARFHFIRFGGVAHQTSLRSPSIMMTYSNSPHSVRRVALLGQFPQPLSLTAGVFTRDHSDVAGYVLAIGETARVSQEHLRRQCCHWSHPGMRQQAERLGPLLDLFFYLPVQLLDPPLQLHVYVQQYVPPLTDVTAHS